MAQVEELPEGAERSIARQIGERLPRVRGFAPGSAPTLDASFPVYVLGADRLRQRTREPRLDQSAMRSDLWHHQVRMSGATSVFARSAERPGSAFEVNEVVQSQLASNMDEAIGWIDANLDDDAKVSVLAVPAFYLTGFIVDQREERLVVVADRPERYRELELMTAYPEAEFLRILGGMEPARGVPDRRAE